MKNNTKIIRCSCYSDEHILLIDEDIEDKMAYVHIHLTKRSLWNRIKYLFGYQCRFGAFEEMILDRGNTEELYNMLKKWHE